MNKVYISTVATLDVEVFYHWLDYYSDMVDDFFITLWGDSTEIDFDDIISVMREFGLSHFNDYRDIDVFNEDFKTKIFNDTIALHPDEWWIPVDCDEFINFENGVKSEIQYNIDNNFDYTFGLLIDRISEDGKLLKLSKLDDIYEKFPMVGNVAMELKGNQTWVDKVSLMRGKDRIISGMHGIQNIDRTKISDVTTQHHHFKWTSRTLENFQKQYNGLRDCHHNWYVEYGTLLDYFKNVPQINVYNPNFMLEDIRHQGEWSRWEEFKELDRSFKDSVNYPHKNNIWDRQ